MKTAKKEASIWDVMHPANIPTMSSRYYASTAESIESALRLKYLLYRLPFPQEFCTRLAQTATGYLEDLSSDFGIWATFRSLCRERYGKTLPFYDSEFGFKEEEYDDDCINFDDVRFIVWMEMNISGASDEMVYSPISDAVEMLSRTVYAIISEKWDDNSPASARVAAFIDNHLNSDDWIEARELALWLAEGCYLTRIYDFTEKAFSSARDLEKQMGSEFQMDVLFYLTRVNEALKNPLRPLGITSLQFLAALARQRNFPEAAKRFGEAHAAGLALYNVIEYDGRVATLRCVRRGTLTSPYIGEIIELDADSLTRRDGLAKGVGMMASAVRWNGLYNVNGMATIFVRPVEEVKEDFIGGIPQQRIEGVDRIREYTKEIIDRNKGSRFVFFNDFDTIRDITGQEVNVGEIDISDGAVMYFGDNGASEVSVEAQMVLKSKRNPFYNKKSAEDDGLAVLGGHAGLGYEAVRSAIGEGMLTDVFINAKQGKRVGRKIVQDNIFFWADFFHSDFGD